MPRHKVSFIVPQKRHGLFWLWNVLISFNFLNTFASRPQFFEFQQEVLKFDICMSWSSPKTGLEMNFSSLENQNLENVNFSQ